ncbi:hypothetical protein KDA11_04645 [Candidatus Saccharibacteria bacterium]|nr:hypothetical protein [Candidatus Saccharibacteria bacterium]
MLPSVDASKTAAWNCIPLSGKDHAELKIMIGGLPYSIQIPLNTNADFSFRDNNSNTLCSMTAAQAASLNSPAPAIGSDGSRWFVVQISKDNVSKSASIVVVNGFNTSTKSPKGVFIQLPHGSSDSCGKTLYGADSITLDPAASNVKTKWFGDAASYSSGGTSGGTSDGGNSPSYSSSGHSWVYWLVIILIIILAVIAVIAVGAWAYKHYASERY